MKQYSRTDDLDILSDDDLSSTRAAAAAADSQRVGMMPV